MPRNKAINGSPKSPSSAQSPVISGHVTAARQSETPSPGASFVGGQDIELICREQLNSATPPDGQLGWTSQENSFVKTSTKQGQAQALAVIISQPNHTPKDHLLKLALLGGSVYPAGSATYKDKKTQIDSTCAVTVGKPDGNVAKQPQRMSGTNGYDRNRMTGSSGGNNENLGWLSDAVASQSHTQSQRFEGMLVGRLGGGAGAVAIHDAGTRSIVAGTVGPSPQVTMASVFRPPLTVSDPPQRYAPVYSTAGSGANLGPYSPLHSSHGQASPIVTMAPYSAFYSQFPNYSPSAILTGHYQPTAESYSAVLHSMGSHAARAPLGPTGSIHQYSLLGSSARTLNPSSSPGPSAAFTPPSTVGVSAGRNDMDLMLRSEHEADHHRRHSTGFLKDEKSRHFSPPSGFSGASRGSLSTSASRESPILKSEPSGSHDYYKVPSTGREGSLKHRILRPSNLAGNMRPSSFSEERSPKRTKFSEPLATNLQSHCVETSETQRAGPVPPSKVSMETGGNNKPIQPHLQYPPHFVKGSIIQLANGNLKRVENLETDDFVQSADISNDLRIDSSTVVQIDENRIQDTAVLGFSVGEHKVQVTVEATLEHPFFVFGQGWSSCEPDRTLQRYGLECHRLTVGDVCISLTHKEVSANAEKISQQQKEQQQSEHSGEFRPLGQGHSSISQGQVNRSAVQGDSNKVDSGDSSLFQIPTSHVSEAQEQKTAGNVEKMDSIPLRKRQWSVTETSESPRDSPAGTIDRSEMNKDSSENT